MPSVDRNQLNVYTLLELRTALNSGCLALPVLGKLFHEDHVMRISHRNRNSTHLACANLHGQLRCYSGFAHLSFKLVLGIAPAGQNASLQSSPGLDPDLLFALLRANIRCHAARAIAGNLRFGAVGVDETNFHVCRRMGGHPLTPSAPTPSWRSHMRRVSAAMSAGAATPAITEESISRKSFPQALAFVNGITTDARLTPFPPAPTKSRCRTPKTLSVLGASPSAHDCIRLRQTASGRAGACCHL